MTPTQELALAHAQAGYANAQDVIKFIDTKASVVTGLVTITTALPLLIFQWLAERESPSALALTALQLRSPILCELTFGFAIATLTCGAFSLACAVMSLRARPLPSTLTTTFLFPASDPKNAGATGKFFEKLRDGLTGEEVLREYEGQLMRVGHILHTKVEHLAHAMIGFQLQIFAFILTLIFAIVGYRA